MYVHLMMGQVEQRFSASNPSWVRGVLDALNGNAAGRVQAVRLFTLLIHAMKGAGDFRELRERWSLITHALSWTHGVREANPGAPRGATADPA